MKKFLLLLNVLILFAFLPLYAEVSDDLTYVRIESEGDLLTTEVNENSFDIKETVIGLGKNTGIFAFFDKGTDGVPGINN